MAQPVPIFVTPSTTFVQVDSLQSPYTPVILNTVSYLGQTVTVLNGLSSVDILANPIAVSTIAGSGFTDGLFRTFIEQPQGYVTAQTVQSNQWAYLNSYPFRDQYISAGVQNLTTSTLYTALTSTIRDITSSMRVENLVVSGNFFQSSGLILNTSVSSLGAVAIVSSLTVNGSTFFQSSVSSLGATVFQSSLLVDGSFFSKSSISITNSLFISTSLTVQGDIDISGTTRPVRIDEGLITTALEVQTSSLTAMNVAGSFFSEGSISTVSSLTVGGSLSLQDLYIKGNLSSLSSTVVHETIQVGDFTRGKGNLFVAGTLGTANTLSVGGTLTVQSTLQIKDSLTVNQNFTSLSSMSTSYLFSDYAYIQGDLTVFSTSFVSTQRLAIRGSLGFQDMMSLSTMIGGNVSTFSDLNVENQLFLGGYLTATGSFSTISSFSVMQDLYTLNAMSIGTSLVVSEGMTVYGNVVVLDTFSTNALQPNLFISSVIETNFSIEGSLTVRDTAILSSIVLPSSVLAYNFITNTFGTAYQGITSNLLVSTLYTSSLTTGGLLEATQTMDMANVFQTLNLSTFLLSSLSLQVGATSQPSTFVQFQSSLGILTQAQPNTFDVNTILYTLSNTYVDKYISSLQVIGTAIQGTFIGDGFLLTDVNYPALLSTLSLSTNKIIVEKTFLSTMLASSGTVVDTFLPLSTLKIGDFYMFGNANQPLSIGSNFLQTIQNSPTSIVLNNMYIYGDTQSIVPKQVVINSNIVPSLSNIYSLGVGGVLRLNNILSPGFSLFIQIYTGDIVVGVSVGSLQTNTMYISSGILGKGNGVFFLPDGYTPELLSTNIVQPILSTLVFNSTLIVDREEQTVGINTKPFYTLDVLSESYAQKGLLSLYSTTIQNDINMNQQRSSFWLAVTSNTTFSNILYSENEGEIWTPFTPTNLAEGFSLLTIATNGGQLSISQSNTLIGQRLWLTGGASLPQYYIEGESSWNYLTYSAKFPISMGSLAFNGDIWVMTGYNSSNLPPATAPPLLWSVDGINWESSLSGGFAWDGVSETYGGRSLAWNGSLWVAVGQGETLGNSILYSGDGKNWSDAITGGFLFGGYGVVWSGSNWVATGNNEGPLSSFCVSVDGSNWTAIGGYGFNGSPNQRGNAIASDGTKVVAVGTYTVGDTSRKSIQYSTDRGLTWQNGTGTLFDSDGDEGYSVVYNGNYWLAGGTSGVRKSYDGIQWTQPSGSPSNMFYGLAFSSNAQPLLQIGASNYVSSFTSSIVTLAVAVGTDVGLFLDSNCMRYSSDGITWSNAVSGFFTEQGRGVAYNGSNLWVAAGKGMMSNFIYSGNGSNWSNGIFLDIISPFAIGTGLVYGGGYWVGTLDKSGGGGEAIFYSSNGSNWYSATNTSTDFSVAGYGVAYGVGRYIAVGEGGNTMLLSASSPPNNWTAGGLTNTFNSKGRGIAFGNSIWVAVGEDTNASTIKYTGDAINWSDASGAFPTAGYGVAYNGSNLWVVAGDGAGITPTSNLLYSGDAINWSNANSGDFLTRAYGVTYNEGLQRWIAAGEGPVGTTLKYSGDGSNWSDATGAFDTYGYGIASFSKTVSTLTTSLNQLRVYNTPGYNVLERNSIPSISYTSSAITFMNTLTVNERKTVSIYTNPTTYVSSFYDPSMAIVSTVVSTNVAQVAGFFLTASLV
jgi:predicted acyltransferase (DUF342 family)